MAGVVKAKRLLVLVACLVAAAGCFWRSYPAVMRTHAQLLVSFARKAQDLVVTRRFAAENLPELTYPLARAAAFAADARRRTADPPESLVAFETLLERYRVIVQLANGSRDASHPDVGLAVADVAIAANQVEAALVREGR